MINLPLYENWINEIGDSSAKKFPYRASQSMDSFFKYALGEGKHYSPSGDLSSQWYRLKDLEFEVNGEKAKYIIKIGSSVQGAYNLSFGGDSDPTLDYQMLSAVSFNVKGATEELETNLGEQYNLMATITEIVVDFLNTSMKYLKVNKMYIRPKADSSDDALLDSRRGKLYLAYVKNNIKKLGGSWTAGMDHKGISIMRGKWTTNDPDSNYIYNENVNETEYEEGKRKATPEEIEMCKSPKGFNQVNHCKALGLIPREDGTKGVSKKYGGDL